jgi:hypothetical protein
MFGFFIGIHSLSAMITIYVVYHISFSYVTLKCRKEFVFFSALQSWGSYAKIALSLSKFAAERREGSENLSEKASICAACGRIGPGVAPLPSQDGPSPGPQRHLFL